MENYGVLQEHKKFFIDSKFKLIISSKDNKRDALRYIF